MAVIFLYTSIRTISNVPHHEDFALSETKAK
jgi:hypothetical protein